jgi:hypothetical protein
MTDDHNDAGLEVDDFLSTLPPVDKRKRPEGWPSRHRIDLIFPPEPQSGESVSTPVSASIRLSNLQAHFIRHAAAAAGVEPAVWAQRHLLAAVGCPPPGAPTPPEALSRIYAGHVHLDALLVTKQ